MQVWYKHFRGDPPKRATYEKPDGVDYGTFIDKKSGLPVSPLPCFWTTYDVVY